MNGSTQGQAADTQLPGWIVWATLALCALPFSLNMAGLDFGIDPPPPGVDDPYARLHGSFNHTLLEWTAFCIAIFTVVLAFIHFSNKRDVTTPIIGMALFCAGSMDAFNTLAAGRVIAGTLDHQDLAPFTWALGRIFNVLILTVGVSILLVRKPRESRGSVRFVLICCAAFGILSYAVIHICAASSNLPATTFPDAWIRKPWDIVPLVLYVGALFLFRDLHRRHPSLLSHALILSVIPAVVLELHMAFGSAAMHDNHFNIAHFLKIITYLIPLSALTVDYVRTSKHERLAAERLAEARRVLERRAAELEAEIDERRRITAALERSEGRYRTILETAADAVISIDAGGRIESANAAAEQMFGYGPQELRNIQIESLMPFRPDRDTNGSASRSREMIAERKDGRCFPIEINANMVRVGGARTYTAIIRDIGSRKQAEQQIRHQTDELKRSNKELRQFAYVASHDLQEPLRMVSSFTQLLQRRYHDKLDDDANEFIGFAVEGVVRMQRLIRDLLTYSRVGSGGGEVQDSNLEEVMDEVQANLASSVEDSGASIAYDTLPTLRADRSQLGQLMQNLISNAIKFKGDAPPRIHISSTRQPSGDCEICVRDNGIGIDPRFQDRIFEIFQRLHSRDEYEGTGVGLAICKRIVELHGGRIWVESAPLGGSEFHFTMPAVAAEKARPIAFGNLAS